ncbi:hypothetical protein TTHERM_01388190 (macronuclear) [Tetrahymena thermophila SB210]|uniref:Uncharacterized protein n=1 Tax=Tetrahymena thermophila (strain SB210) TaxID=312017 RepID=Q229L5_TETTS|nr:hypothetical protein TTHERM_01388190 [Tetrahymena thermophila SB210]EAR81986.1 hypothetical protein TTHERM_01388190 [Tetrahymena thermophila SB210]|eukprot:XP_001029649.1 hypothetical protein TTHERM_01388190 [Tetrahymena thermophila SB210]
MMKKIGKEYSDSNKSIEECEIESLTKKEVFEQLQISCDKEEFLCLNSNQIEIKDNLDLQLTQNENNSVQKTTIAGIKLKNKFNNILMKKSLQELSECQVPRNREIMSYKMNVNQNYLLY